MEIFLVIFIPILFLLFNIFLYFLQKRKYEKTSYYSETQTNFLDMMTNSGIRGEYSVFNIIKQFAITNEKFLFNVYIPTYKDKTTEIDIIMITIQGIFVIESKNYSGWIFGNENYSNWTQSLHIGYGRTQKNKFYNPIMQNEYHIKYLKKFLNTKANVYSIVVFSNNCTFKNITRKNNSSSYLIQLDELYETIKNIREINNNNLLSEDEINIMYDKLYPCSHVDEQTKAKHINDLKQNNN